jgi:DNA-binding NarL/FixJ family response regulator
MPVRSRRGGVSETAVRTYVQRAVKGLRARNEVHAIVTAIRRSSGKLTSNSVRA